MANKWITALKQYNVERKTHNNNKWCVPKRGHSAMKQVRKIMKNY